MCHCRTEGSYTLALEGSNSWTKVPWPRFEGFWPTKLILSPSKLAPSTGMVLVPKPPSLQLPCLLFVMLLLALHSAELERNKINVCCAWPAALESSSRKPRKFQTRQVELQHMLNEHHLGRLGSPLSGLQQAILIGSAPHTPILLLATPFPCLVHFQDRLRLLQLQDAVLVLGTVLPMHSTVELQRCTTQAHPGPCWTRTSPGDPGRSPVHLKAAGYYTAPSTGFQHASFYERNQGPPSP